MNTFYINLNEMSNKGKRLFSTWLYVALVLVVLIGISLVLLESLYFNIVTLVYLLVYIYIARTTYRAKLYIESTDYALVYKFGLMSRSANKIVWETVRRVKLGPAYMTFYKRTGKHKVIKLGWLPYAKVVLIKRLVEEVCIAKGIEYQVAGYK